MATDVFFSVGPAGDMKDPANMTISGGIATLDAAQTGDIGVGDRMTWGAGFSFIVEKISQSQWRLRDGDGSTPGDIAVPTALVSIEHEFSNNINANANYDDADHVGNTSLIVADVVMHIPNYYRLGGDTTYCFYFSINTDSTRYLDVYAPNDTVSECNNNQRHDGKWNTSRQYFYKNTGNVVTQQVAYAMYRGLSVKYHNTSSISFAFVFASAAWLVGWTYMDDCIVEGDNNNANRQTGAYMQSPVTNAHTFYLRNFAVCNMGKNSNSMGIQFLATATGYIYNMSCANAIRSIQAPGGGATNVTIKNCVGLDPGPGYDAFTGSYNANSANCADENGSGPGSGAITLSTDVITDYFVSGTDLHLDPTATNVAELIGAGVNLFADANLPVTDDFEGDARPAVGSFDVGAHQYISDPNVPTINNFNTGATTPNTTPGLSFDLSAPEAGTGIKYQVQIDDTAGYLSPIQDVTEGATAPTPRPATIYTAAALADDSYYWRVRCIDEYGHQSAWANANGGAVAFIVSTAPPTPTGTARGRSSLRMGVGVGI